MEEYENEKELSEYLDVIWRKKWLIILPTCFIIVIVAIYSLTLPKIWEVQSILSPSKFLIQTEGGQFEEVIVTSPAQIAGQINEGAYNNIISAELNIDLRKFPKLHAKTLKDTNLVLISTKDEEAAKARSIQLSLFAHLKGELDKKIDVEIKDIDTQVEQKKSQLRGKDLEIKNSENAIKQKELRIEDKYNVIKNYNNRIKDERNAIKLNQLRIESKEIEKTRITGDIITSKNKLTISKDRVESIATEMKEVKTRIDRIEEEQRAVLEKGSAENSLSILLYSNEIQNNLRYYNTLEEKQSMERITQENLNSEIEDKKESLKQADNQIEQMKTQLDIIETRIDDINTQIDIVKNEIQTIKNEIETVHNGISLIRNEIEMINSEIIFLEQRKGRIDFARLVKEPTSSVGPVAPKKTQMVIIAGFVSGFMFLLLAFFLNYINENKKKTREESHSS